jgi:hypothetical protein
MNKIAPLLVGATILTATVLYLTDSYKPTEVAHRERSTRQLCEEVRFELEIYEPRTASLTPEMVKEIVNRCYRSFVK